MVAYTHKGTVWSLENDLITAACMYQLCESCKHNELKKKVTNENLLWYIYHSKQVKLNYVV